MVPNLDFETFNKSVVPCYSNSDFDNDCTVRSPKSLTPDDTSSIIQIFSMDVSCNSNSAF